MVSCSPGVKNIWSVLMPLKACWAMSNCSGLERCETSPVWITKDGATESPLTSPMACCSVPSTLGLASRWKPIWESLICTKLKSALPAAVAASRVWALNTPPFMAQSTPPPAQAMHFRSLRRSSSCGCSCCFMLHLVGQTRPVYVQYREAEAAIPLFRAWNNQFPGIKRCARFLPGNQSVIMTARFLPPPVKAPFDEKQTPAGRHPLRRQVCGARDLAALRQERGGRPGPRQVRAGAHRHRQIRPLGDERAFQIPAACRRPQADRPE